jgi:flagellar assembly factor FliW
MTRARTRPALPSRSDAASLLDRRTPGEAGPAAPLPVVEGMPVAARDVIRFPQGLPGFEACRGFVLMASESLGPLQCLKATAGPACSFLVVDPRRVFADYRCRLSDADRQRLGASETDALLWLVLITIELDGTITANLRAPIVINPARMVGHQVVPHDCLYPIRHVVVEGSE